MSKPETEPTADQPQTKQIKGLSCDIPIGIVEHLSARTISILYALQQFGATSFEVNPSDPIDDEMLGHIKQIAGDNGFHYVSVPGSSLHYLLDPAAVQDR